MLSCKLFLFLALPAAIRAAQLEPIAIEEIPLPPAVESVEAGACSYNINPRGTGCIGKSTGLQTGNFLPDGNHVLASVDFVGAPTASDPRSIYEGHQLLILKTDGTSFPNGDSWKCLTCGVPAEQSIGFSPNEWAYPQAFKDGKRVLAGTYVIECSNLNLVSEQCGPRETFIYPIRMENSTDGTGLGAQLRELRLHPDDYHIGVNVFSTDSGKLAQTAYVGRLQFDPHPSNGAPLAPRYDMLDVNQLFNPNGPQPLSVVGDNLILNETAISVGELRGFSGTGREVLYVGYPLESCNIDVFAVDLYTGDVRRLTSHPGYVDPVQMSPDDASIVIMDTRGNDRVNFMAGLRGIPPLLDQVTTTACSSVRNNGRRRFFQPWLLDGFGDRHYDNYYGQEINAASDGVAGTGAFDDPEWNGMADPWFSPDGTAIVYWQMKTLAPACGGPNPLPCYDSTAPGGRTERAMIARLVDRTPIDLATTKIVPAPAIIPWAVPYVPGKTITARVFPKEGNYTLWGQVSGFANVTLIAGTEGTRLSTVRVSYHGFSNNGHEVFQGVQTATEQVERLTVNKLLWHSDLLLTGNHTGSQKTDPQGFRLVIDVLQNVFEANGTLTTIFDGKKYTQPADGQ